MKNEVDSTRFIAKPFKRRRSFPHSGDDYSILIDGLTAGRIMKKVIAGERVVWFWTLTAPFYPFKSSCGEAATYEAARDAFKDLFEEWHSWALSQTGKATWYGSDE